MTLNKNLSKNIQEVVIDNPITPKEKLIWLNICNAGKNEIEYLRKKYNFNMAHLRASSCRAFAQRAMVEYGDNYLFMILHYPVFRDGKITPEEIDFFVGHGYLITLHNNNLPALNNFFKLCKKETGSLLAFQFESASILLYELLDKLVQSCYELLDKNSIAISDVEKLIFERDPKTAVSRILSLRLNIINIRKTMQNHKNVMKKLTERESKYAPASEVKKFYNSLIEHTKRIWENLENQKETIEVLNNTNESLLNDRISNIMKTLTIFSVIVFPLTLFAAIFGMNTIDGMPFVDTPNGFWVIIAFMLTSCFGMLLIFEKKKWL
jgi:magnesium transporter